MTVSPATGSAHERALRTVKALVVLSVLGALVALLAGAGLLFLDPDDGSGVDSTLGITMAIAGLATAGLVVAAVVYAQVKHLWHHAPDWVRITVWVVAVLALGLSLVRTLSD